MTKDVFAWVPRHVGIWGNTSVDVAAKQTLENPLDKRLVALHIDFKVLTSLYIKGFRAEWCISTIYHA